MKHAKPKRILYASHWWLEDLMRAVAHQAAERAWHVDFQMCLTGELPESWQGDGILTNLGGDLDTMQAFLESAACPAVSFNPQHPEIEVCRVGPDKSRAGQLAAEHFLEREFRSFAHYTRNRPQVTEKLDKSFEEALARASYTKIHGLSWLDYKKKKNVHDSWENRHRWLRRELCRLPKPLAVLAGATLGPAEIIEAASAEGLEVPHEVAVLGMFDIAFFRESTTVPVSTIVHDFENHAEVACDLLARMMDGAPRPSAPILIPPLGIAARRSTDTLAARVPAVARAIRHMLDHYSEPLNVADIVRVGGTSQTGLYKAFKDDLGQAPHEVLTRIRVQQAKHMLRNTDDKLRTVAEECGFGDPVNLFRQFKQRFGLAPAEYREQAREPEGSKRKAE